MAENSPSRLWFMRALYPLLALGIMFAQLMPIRIMPEGLAGPDLLTALTLAWAIRRPDYVPALSIAAVMLLADMLFQRPPGLWALLVLIASEFCKSRGRYVRENTFVAEWISFSAILLATTLAYRLVLAVLIISPGMLSLVLIQYGMTVAAYPLVAAVSYLAFGVRRSAPGEYDHTGRSL
ncbi:rod shape-determining protein MreD [Sagittula sp. SSi028]|uniref:rod shape-determining protein MreD n=1 Tax=Sagittula sp. SSi028 TaxID=3400636 RepID=UPI003AF62F5B